MILSAFRRYTGCWAVRGESYLKYVMEEVLPLTKELDETDQALCSSLRWRPE
jgi:hypothetical protein